MDFYIYLCEKYGKNEAILFKDIKYKDYSKPWIKKELCKLCKENKLVRYEKGVYYIPTKTLLGQSVLDSKEVIIKKYVKDDKETYGYFSGVAFMNMIGLSTQMPNTFEIYTNNENANVRKVNVGGKDVVLRKSRTTITSENAPVMSFLELMNYTDADFYDSEKKAAVENYIKGKNIIRKQISEYAKCYPDKAMRTLIESEIIYYVTQ